MNSRRVIICVLLLVMTALIGGCGDDGEQAAGESPSSPSGEAGQSGSPSEESGGRVISKAVFVELANEACEEAKGEFRAKLRPVLAANADQASEEELLMEVIDKALAPSLEREIDELYELGPPSGDEDEIDAIAVAIEDLIAGAREDPVAFGRSSRTYEKPEKLARAYGIGECGTFSLK